MCNVAQDGATVGSNLIRQRMGEGQTTGAQAPTAAVASRRPMRGSSNNAGTLLTGSSNEALPATGKTTLLGG